jgi:hypothetical protein
VRDVTTAMLSIDYTLSDLLYDRPLVVTYMSISSAAFDIACSASFKVFDAMLQEIESRSRFVFGG